jgi:hypothetical protein
MNYVYADVSDTGDALGNARRAIHTLESCAQIEF